MSSSTRSKIYVRGTVAIKFWNIDASIDTADPNRNIIYTYFVWFMSFNLNLNLNFAICSRVKVRVPG